MLKPCALPVSGGSWLTGSMTEKQPNKQNLKIVGKMIGSAVAARTRWSSMALVDSVTSLDNQTHCENFM